MATYHIEPEADNLHGHFDKKMSPILTIQSGDTITAKTLDAGWGIEAPKTDGSDRQRHAKYADLEMKGHCLVGPIAIEGARAGHTLEVRIEEIVVGDFGFTYGGGWGHAIHKYLGIDEGKEERLVWDLDAESNIGLNQLGHEIDLHPFLGVMGVAPPEDGQHSTPPPRIWGGNIDCKELVAGTTLYLPIGVDGALFSFGDGHAAQGQGEVSVQAIECPMERVKLTLTVRDDMMLDAPRARIDGAWLTFGFHEDLHQASLIALEDMAILMMERYDLNMKQAIALASPTVDLIVTQIANPTLGVHAVLRDDIIRMV